MLEDFSVVEHAVRKKQRVSEQEGSKDGFGSSRARGCRMCVLEP